MEQFSALFSSLTSAGVIALQAAVIIVSIALVFKYTPITDWIARHKKLLLVLISGGALLGSLAYSYIIGFSACYLCWIQRILIIPVVGITVLGYVNKLSPKQTLWWSLPFIGMGTIVAIYHTLIQNGIGAGNALCQALGGSSCVQLYVYEFGYITIPVMSLTVFVALLVLSCVRTSK